MSKIESFNLVEFSMHTPSREVIYFKCPQIVYPDAKQESIYAFQDSCVRHILASDKHFKLVSAQMAYSVAPNGLCLCLKETLGYLSYGTEQKLRYIWELNTIEEMLTSDDEVLKEWGFKLLKEPSLMEKRSV